MIQNMRIEEEINQRQFQSSEQKALINILFTTSWLSKEQSKVLKPFGLSMQQFNILRILRGMKGQPATVKLLTERMIDRMSNASRLVDKLLQKGLVRREICSEDRRKVDIFISDKGMSLAELASAAIDNSISDIVGLDSDEAALLSNLLDKLRE